MIQQVKDESGHPIREKRDCPKCGQSFTVTKCEAPSSAPEDYARWVQAHPWFPKGCGACERAELRRLAGLGRDGMTYVPGWGRHRDTGELVPCVNYNPPIERT